MVLIKDKKEAIDIILEQKVLALFQGESEWGPRALGNRSMLFDARNPLAQEIVNGIKKREWWRPFAGTIMLEYAHEWFEMGTLKESPYMSFAIDAKEIALKTIPSIIHSGTCRIQTVTKEQNKHFYELIEEFYNRTGVPIILNTSLNLAGHPLAETIDNVMEMCEKSEMKHVYFPN